MNSSMDSSIGKFSAFITQSILNDWRPQLGIKPSMMRLFKIYSNYDIIFSPRGPGCLLHMPRESSYGKNRTPSANKNAEQQEIAVEKLPSYSLPGKLAVSQGVEHVTQQSHFEEFNSNNNKSIRPYVHRLTPLRRIILLCLIIALIWKQI